MPPLDGWSIAASDPDMNRLKHCSRAGGILFLACTCLTGVGSGKGGPGFFLNDHLIDMEAIQPALAEAAGAQVLEEFILDRLLEAECREAEIEIGASEIDAERDRLLESLGRIGDDRERLGELVRELRVSRGLGDERFAALLRRNAMLRALVRDRVEVDDEQIGIRYAIVYGPKVRVRAIVVPTVGEAGAIVEQLRHGEGPIWARFAELALAHSTDSSRASGGLLEPFSLQDPAYPASMRRAIEALEAGDISPPVALDDGFGVFLLVERIEAREETLEEVREEVRRDLARRQERLLMEQMAGALLERASIRVVDPHLSWAWSSRRVR